MQPKTDTNTAVRKLKEDDLARQTVLRYQRNQNVLNGDDLVIQIIRKLAEKTWQEQKFPETVGEWIALILYYGHTPQVADLRQKANEHAQAAYVQAHTWLEILDNIRQQEKTG